MGSHQAIAVPGLPVYDGTQVVDLALAIIVGILAALVVAGVRQIARAHRRRPRRLRAALPLLGGAAARRPAGRRLADLLGADSQDVLFSGQASIPTSLGGGLDADRGSSCWSPRRLAYAICLGCGFRGGPVFPAMFIGVALATSP